MLLGNVVIYAIGVPWLHVSLGSTSATEVAFGPDAVHRRDAIKLLLAAGSSRRRGGSSAGVPGALARARGVRGPIRGATHIDRACMAPTAQAWRLNREAMLLLGAGPRALLLQLAHPAVAAGVDEHSDFRTDPWAPPLQATLRSYLAIVYGPGRGTGEIRRQRAPPLDHRDGLCRARPGPVPVGPRDARRDDDGRVDAWLEPLSRA